MFLFININIVLSHLIIEPNGVSLHTLNRRTELATQLGFYKHYIMVNISIIMMAEQDDDAAGEACEFALLSIRNKIVPPISAIDSQDTLEVFLGTLSGIIAGWGMVLEKKDNKMYKKLLTALEQMSLRYGGVRGRGLQ